MKKRLHSENVKSARILNNTYKQDAKAPNKLRKVKIIATWFILRLSWALQSNNWLWNLWDLCVPKNLSSSDELISKLWNGFSYYVVILVFTRKILIKCMATAKIRFAWSQANGVFFMCTISCTRKYFTSAIYIVTDLEKIRWPWFLFYFKKNILIKVTDSVTNWAT